MRVVERFEHGPNVHLCTTPRNEYGDKVAAHAIYDPETGHVLYRCSREHWRHDFDAWVKARRNGDKDAPEPVSDGHCMFLRPVGYACVPVGVTAPNVIRRALRNHQVAVLNGWDREMRKTPEGMRQLAKIVKATVTAKMKGQETGGGPFVACIMAGM